MSDQNIGVFVMSSHENYFENLLRILESFYGNVTIFSSAKYIENIRVRGINVNTHNIITKSNTEPFPEFLKRASNYWNENIDTLISFPFYGNVKEFFNYVQVDRKCYHIQMIFNVNSWAMINLRFTPRLDRYVSLLLRRYFLDKVDHIMVEYSTIKKYFLSVSNNNIHNEDISVFTPIIYTGKFQSNSKFSVTIPGHIESRRRNYTKIIQLLKENLTDLKSELKIYLLGSYSHDDGANIIRRCKNLNNQGWDIVYFDDWVSTEQFENILKESDLILSPIRKYIEVGPVIEQYGKSKGSGSFGDAIKYGKPLVLPDHYEVPPETENIVSTYADKQDLAETIRQFRYSDGLSKKDIKKIQQIFNMSTQRKKLSQILAESNF